MKHKNAEMIKAKVDNMKLVVFYRLPNEEWWQQDSECEALPDEVEIDYFLCLPQHKEVCLHWLNGGEVERLTAHQGFLKVGYGLAWSACHEFMNEELNFRVKPKKEKRWIAVNPDGYILPIHADSKESIMTHASFDTSRLTPNVQFIEIEVEI